jgi:diguanylate cyclase (GGDEF)-like protein
LVVDDTRDTSGELAEALACGGHTVNVVHDLRGAEDLLLRARIDSRLNMPEAVVLVLSELRARGQTLLDQLHAMHVPSIVALTPAHSSPAAVCLDAGADDVVVQPADYPLLLARIRRLIRWSRESAALRADSYVDCVSGLLNRRAFERELERLVHRAVRTRRSLTVSFIDLDGFKEINDTYGHVMGDRVLRYVGASIDEAVRRCDLSCRWGGDEFAIALPGSAAAEARQVTERLRALVSERTRASLGHAMQLSYGMASLFDDVLIEPNEEPTESLPPRTSARLIDAADRAMYSERRRHSGQGRATSTRASL